MAYTATKYFTPKAFPYPRGQDKTMRNYKMRGQLVDCSTPTNYTPGGIGSSAFEVTAFSAVGLVTFSALLGAPLVNGQRVVIYNTASNTNDGTYIVSNLVYTSASAGTFTAVPLPFNTLSGTGQTSQTAEGVGQLQWSARSPLNSTLTITAVTVSGGVATLTYTTLAGGPQPYPGSSLVVTGMTNAGNNGTFSVTAVNLTSATAGSLMINNPNAVASDSGSGTLTLQTGFDDYPGIQNPTPPVIVGVGCSLQGILYVWDNTNYTLRAFIGAGSAVLAEIALGANAVLEKALYFEATFPQGPLGY